MTNVLLWFLLSGAAQAPATDDTVRESTAEVADAPAPETPPTAPARTNDDDDAEPAKDAAPESIGVATPLGFLGACGTSGATYLAAYALNVVVNVIPGVGTAAAVVFAIAAPLLAGATGWVVLTRIGDWRAPLIPMLLGAAIPAWSALGLNAVVGVLVGIAVAVITGTLISTAYAVLIGSRGSTEGIVAFLAAYLAAALIPAGIAVVGGLFALVVTVTGWVTGALLSAALGVTMGRPRVEGESGWLLDWFTVAKASAMRPGAGSDDEEDEDKPTPRQRKRGPSAPVDDQWPPAETTPTAPAPAPTPEPQAPAVQPAPAF